MRQLFLLAALLGAIFDAHAEIESGLWYDRSHDGHGLDLHRQGPVLFGTFYTFDARNAVEWLWIQTEDSEAPASALTRFSRNAAGQVLGAPAGNIRLTSVQTCPDGLPRPGARQLLRMDFVLDERAATWCVEPLLPVAQPSMAVLSGAWYAPIDPGWGLMTHAYTGANGVTQAFRIAYFHDRSGHPRWAFSIAPGDALTQSLTFYTPYVECTDCTISPPLTMPVGQATLTLSEPLVDADPLRNRIQLSLSFEGEAPFVKNATLGILSDRKRVIGSAATSEGPVAGAVIELNGVERFMNIPYAQPPLAALRWRAPQPAPLRTHLASAHLPGVECPQPGSGDVPQSEDCLQLNVWRPATPGPHPVMVWIHGGGLTQGSAVKLDNDGLLYDGEYYAERGIVYVSINYRLGLLGYLAQRDFVAEAADQPQAGNYGLLDQIAALRWVQRNIGHFGGDPARVTIFGESAGGVSVCALMGATATRGLFQRAIVQSGNCHWSLPSLESGLQQGDRVTTATGCANATDKRTCLRALTPAQLMTAVPPVVDPAGFSDGESFGLVIDGHVLSEPSGRSIAAGRAAPVPLIIGVNDDETTSLVPASMLPATASGYEAAIRTRFPAIAESVLQIYPAAAYPSPQRAYQDLLDDLLFNCAARRTAADHASQGQAAYHYVLTEVLPQPGLAAFESFHGLDVVLLHGPRSNAEWSEQVLAERMQRTWADFANGVEPPGSSDFITWPRYRAETRRSLELNGAGIVPMDDYRRNQCEFWNRIVPL